jgi:hypothetical protein
MITIAHEPTITGTNVAREIFDSLRIGDYSAAISRLDQSNVKWTKLKLVKTLKDVGCDQIGDWRKIKRSSNPKVDYDETGFTFTHRIPGLQSWLDVAVVLRFLKKNGSVYHIEMNFVKL